jgi:hypothetical protein
MWDFLDLLSIRINVTIFSLDPDSIYIYILPSKTLIIYTKKKFFILLNQNVIMGLLRFFKSKSTQCLTDMVVNTDHSSGMIFVNIS